MEKLKFKNSPKLILSKEFLAEIAYLHATVIKGTEWSGLLYYEIIEGTIKEPNTLKLKARHVFLHDIGTAGSTEYEVDDDIIDFYDQFPEALTKWKVGHMHTHHNMSTNPSSVDIAEIEDNVKHHNYYLSLIVNYDGRYTAIIGIEVENEGKQKYTDESGVKRYWEIKNHKEVYIIDIDIEFETDEWFEDQFINIQKSNVDEKSDLLFIRHLLKKEKGRVSFVKGLEQYSKQQKWNKNTAVNVVKKDFLKQMEEWATMTGIHYRTTYELKSMLEDIESYKNSYSIILCEVLIAYIKERESKYKTHNNYRNYKTSKENNNGKKKDNKVQWGRMGQLGFRY